MFRSIYFPQIAQMNTQISQIFYQGIYEIQEQ